MLKDAVVAPLAVRRLSSSIVLYRDLYASYRHAHLDAFAISCSTQRSTLHFIRRHYHPGQTGAMIVSWLGVLLSLLKDFLY